MEKPPSEAFETGRRMGHAIADAIGVLLKLGLAFLVVLVTAWLCGRVSETLSGIVWLIGGIWWIINAAGSGKRWRMRNFPRSEDFRSR
jgi:hypothetical protein